MGVSVQYVAIPPTSSLYIRAQTVKPLAILMTALFNYGSTIYRFFEIDPEEREEIVEGLIEDFSDVFSSEAEARHWLKEFRAELEHTRATFPGIEKLWASLQKTSHLVEERLLQCLQPNNEDSAEPLVGRLLFGNQTFAGHFFPSRADPLGLISTSVVREGANLLRPLDPDRLFVADEENARDHFSYWRELYLQADQRGEELLVDVR